MQTAEPVTLKTINPFFQDVWDGLKTFEIRKNDRGFHVGQILWLDEYAVLDDETGRGMFKNHRIVVKVRHILTHDDFPQGLQPGYVAMSIQVLDKILLDTCS